MTKHEIKRCARCDSAFECKANNPVHCGCAEVVLSRELAERLGETYDDCLCVTCLKALQADPEGITAGG